MLITCKDPIDHDGVRHEVGATVKVDNVAAERLIGCGAAVPQALTPNPSPEEEGNQKDVQLNDPAEGTDDTEGAAGTEDAANKKTKRAK